MYLPSSILTPADISQYIVVLLTSLSSPAITPDGKATVCTTLKSFKNAKVVIQLYFHTSSSSIFMKFDTHKH